MRTGIACVNDLSKRRKPKKEEKHPRLLLELHQIMAPVSQAESHLKTDWAYTKMTSTSVRSALLEWGLPTGAVPTLRTLSNILNRHKYRLRRVEKSQVQKNRVHRPDLRKRKAGERTGGCRCVHDPLESGHESDRKHWALFQRRLLSEVVKAADHDMRPKIKLASGGILEPVKGKAFL